jgi:hypothetical protein
MQRQWRIRVKGVQQQEVNLDLLIQAVLELGSQIAKTQEKEQAIDSSRKEPA